MCVWGSITETISVSTGEERKHGMGAVSVRLEAVFCLFANDNYVSQATLESTGDA